MQSGDQNTFENFRTEADCPITQEWRVAFLGALVGSAHSSPNSVPMFLDEWQQSIENKNMPEAEKQRERDRLASWKNKFVPLVGKPDKLAVAIAKEKQRQEKLGH